ncbi:YopX family protein [Sporosarcina jiandibaonis]|uniref:YopX family protein n=1 Tax=Sporosarcina jiandibaonis TaxID=2715535 RepID=UPI0015571A71|nr:YopX family protein [Sporosarcina jiandibaonis]
MRPIKFRAWEKSLITGQTLMNPEPEFFQGSINKHFSNGGGFFSEIKYMQFTVLKDKNGVEIYEGDVLNSISSFQKETGQVVFYDGAFCLSIISSRTTKSKSKYFLSTCKELEVIGNIYENPELLEVTE